MKWMFESELNVSQVIFLFASVNGNGFSRAVASLERAVAAAGWMLVFFLFLRKQFLLFSFKIAH